MFRSIMWVSAFLCLTLVFGRPASAIEHWTLSYGEARTLKQPQRSAEIELYAEAGDTLFGDMDPVRIGAGIGEPSLLVRDVATRTVLQEAGAALVFKAPKSGVYRIEFTDIVRFTLWRLAPDDPRVNPGLHAADVSVDTAALGFDLNAGEVPPYPIYLGDPPPSGWPAHIELYSGKKEEDKAWMYYGDDRFWLAIYPASGIHRLYTAPKGHPALIDPLRALDVLLSQTKPIRPNSNLPLFPQPEAAIFFAAEAEKLQLACFSALRYVAFVAQDNEAPYPRLSYIVQGLSVDGRFFMSVDAEIKVPSISGFEHLSDAPSVAEMRRYHEALSDFLVSHPEQFSPTVMQLDNALRTLRGPCER